MKSNVSKWFIICFNLFPSWWEPLWWDSLFSQKRICMKHEGFPSLSHEAKPALGESGNPAVVAGDAALTAGSTDDDCCVRTCRSYTCSTPDFAKPGYTFCIHFMKAKVRQSRLKMAKAHNCGAEWTWRSVICSDRTCTSRINASVHLAHTVPLWKRRPRRLFVATWMQHVQQVGEGTRNQDDKVLSQRVLFSGSVLASCVGAVWLPVYICLCFGQQWSAMVSNVKSTNSGENMFRNMFRNMEKLSSRFISFHLVL